MLTLRWRHLQSFLSSQLLLIKGQKWKTISDMVQDESEHIQVTCIKIVEVQAKEKTACEKLKHQSLTGIEHKHLQFQHEEDGLYFIFMRPFWLLFVVASIQVVS